MVINMNKKVVVLGGGTGLSTLLRGLKQFPLDITAIVSVCDDGKSTGVLRKEFNIPAVGDIRRVIVSLSETEPLIEKLLNYRFSTSSDLNNHTVGNLLLTALANISGNMSDGIESLGKVLNLKGKVLPLTEDNVILMGQMEDDTIVEGEHNITESYKKIKRVFYKEKATTNPLVLKEIENADLIILSMGSLYTSIIPNLLCDDIRESICNSKAKIMYTCNMMTQPGETDDFKASDHLKVLNSYLNRNIDVILVNNGIISENTKKEYETLEQKNEVVFDENNLKNMKVDIIQNDYVSIDNNVLRHKVDKLSLDIYTYLLNRGEANV